MYVCIKYYYSDIFVEIILVFYMIIVIIIYLIEVNGFFNNK